MATPKRPKRPNNPDALTAPIPLTAAMKPPTRPLLPPPPSRLIRPNAAFDRLLHKSPVPRTITAAYESLRPSLNAQPPPGGYSVLSDFGVSRDEPLQKPFVGSRLRHGATAEVENRDATTTAIPPTPVSSMSAAVPFSPPPPPPPEKTATPRTPPGKIVVAQKPTPHPTPKPGGEGGAPNSERPAEQQQQQQQAEATPRSAEVSTAAAAYPQTMPNPGRSDASRISGTAINEATATPAAPAPGKPKRRPKVSDAAAEAPSTGRRIATRATAPDIDPIELPKTARKHRHSDGATATPVAAPAKRQRASGGSEPAPTIITFSPPLSPPVLHITQKAKSSVGKDGNPSGLQPQTKPASISATPHPPPPPPTPPPPPPTRHTRSANKLPVDAPPAAAAAARSSERPTTAPRAPRFPETPKTPIPPARSSSRTAPRSLPSRRAAKARQMAGTAEPAVRGSVDGGPGGIFLIPAQILAVTGSLIDPGGRRVSGRRHTLGFPPPATAAVPEKKAAKAVQQQAVAKKRLLGAREDAQDGEAVAKKARVAEAQAPPPPPPLPPATAAVPKKKAADAEKATAKKQMLGAREGEQDGGAVAEGKARVVEAQAPPLPPPPETGSRAGASKGVGAAESSGGGGGGGGGGGWRRWARALGSEQATLALKKGSNAKKVRSIATPPKSKKDRDIYDYNFSDEE